MNNVAFLIPILIECPERERNLLDQLRYLLPLGATIYLFECDTKPKVPLLIGNLSKEVRYQFIESDLFHRTQLLNRMAIAAKEFSVIVLHDVDVFIPIQQYIDANGEILDKALDFCFPYTIWHWITKYSEPLTKEGAEELHGSTGGSIFCRRSAFVEAGMENENCISWGMEDIERFARWTTLGFRIGRIDGCLYHAEHPRNKNSGVENPYYVNNKLEAEKVRAMTKTELEQYIKTWSWLRADPLPVSDDNGLGFNDNFTH
jgi:hypothetical protein